MTNTSSNAINGYGYTNANASTENDTKNDSTCTPTPTPTPMPMSTGYRNHATPSTWRRRQPPLRHYSTQNHCHGQLLAGWKRGATGIEQRFYFILPSPLSVLCSIQY
jgi:hypothetical protein